MSELLIGYVRLDRRTGPRRATRRPRPARRAVRTDLRRPQADRHRQEAHLVELHRAGEHSTAELDELFSVRRSTVYRAIERAAVKERSKASDDR